MFAVFTEETIKCKLCLKRRTDEGPGYQTLKRRNGTITNGEQAEAWEAATWVSVLERCKHPPGSRQTLSSWTDYDSVPGPTRPPHVPGSALIPVARLTQFSHGFCDVGTLPISTYRWGDRFRQVHMTRKQWARTPAQAGWPRAPKHSYRDNLS